MATVGTADINPDDNSLQALLLREAQDEIAKLRGEIYSTRKVAEDRRQAQGALERQNKQLSGQVTDLCNKLRACEAEAKRVPLLEAELMELRQLREHVQRERQLHGEARKILESELRDERAARQQAEEAKARTDGERSRLQKARDELAAQLRVAQRKAIDAEEEQCRAEDEAAAARAELYALQQQQQQKQTGGPNGAEDDNDASHVASSASLQAAVEQLQAERARASSLSSALNATKAQLEQVHTQLRQAQEERAAAAAAAATASASATATAPNASSESSAVVVALREELAQVRAVAERAQSALQAECARVQQLEAALQQHGDGFAAAQQAHHPHHRDGFSGGSSSAAAAPQSVHATAAQPAAGSVAELVQQLAQLHSKVAALKLSRDRLLVVIDTHSVEIERLMTENKVLTEELTEARQLADKWEAQAQDSLTYVDKLKDLLEESAEWAASAGTDGPNAPSAAAGNGNSSTTVEQVHGALLREQAARAGLELQGHIDRRDLEAYALNNGLPVNYVEHFLSAVLRTGVSAGVASVGSTQRFSGGRTTCSLSSSHVGVPESSSGSGSGNEDEPEVTFELFKRFVRGREDALRRAFKLFDRDRDGRISFQDLDRSLSHVMVSCPRTRCSYRCRQKAVKELIRKMDADGNKTVEFGEFRDFFMLLPQTEMMVDYWLSAAAAGGCCDVGGRVTLRHAELATAKGASPWGHLIAGALAGAASRTATAPLETLRLAAMAGTVEASTPLLAAAQQLMAVHGWRGLYRGNGINVLRSAPAKALDFFAFDFFKTRFGDGGLASTFLSAGCAGALSMLLLYPLEVVRSRMTIDVAGKYGGSAVQALQIIVREQGARSLFRGLIPSVAAIFPEAAITYGLHDQLKRSYRRLHHNREPGILPSLGFGVFSAFSGQLVSYPLETVSRRLQVAGGRSSATAIVAALLKEGGPTALYRGLGAATLRLVPMALISFGTYEVARATLINMETNSANARAEWEANQLTAHLQPLHAD